VSTKIGVAGLKTKTGENVIVSDTFGGLANGAISLLKNSQMAEKIGRKGQMHVRKYFDWKSIVKLHEPIYKKLRESVSDI